MDIAEKIAEARDNGHGISPHLGEILADLDARLSQLEPKKDKPLPVNPFDGERIDS